MATRYWVGGTGTWDATTTTNWSATSGGAGGASAPTSADDVVFDAASDAGAIFTVTVGTGAVCRDITAGSLDFTMTLAGSAAWSVYGSLTFPATNFTRTYTGDITFAATSTGKIITTNGVQLTSGALVLSGSGGEWTLGSAITVGGVNLFAGTFRTNNFNVTAANIFSSYSTVRAFYLGTSTVTLSVGGLVDFTNKTNLTFDSGTSTIIGLAATPTFNGGGLTFYNVSFTSTAAGTATITGANTFNNLTFTSLAATGIRNISISANQTINGTLTLGTANTAIRRMFVFSDVVGTPRTITANAIATLADVDFRDIVAAGASGTWAGTRLGNCLGNSNITFAAGKNVYWNLVGGGNFSSTAWALSSGGAVSASNFPLAQDSVVFEDTGLNSGVIVYIGWNWNIGGINTSGRTLPMGLDFVAINLYKNITFHSGLTVSGTGVTTFSGQGATQQITSAGRTFTQPLTINNATGTLQLADALITSGAFTLTSGTVALNGFDLTALTFSSSNSNTRSIAFGANKIVVTGNNATIWDTATATNYSYTGSGIIEFNYSGSVGTRNIRHGYNSSSGTNANSPKIKITAGTDIINIQSTTFVKDLDFTGFAGSFPNTEVALYGSVIFSTGMTIGAGATAWRIVGSVSAGTQTITTNGKTLDFPISKVDSSTLQLADALTMGSTRTFTHTVGAIDLNGKTLTVGAYSSTGAVARNISFNSGSIVDLGAWTVSGSNFTTSGVGTISMTSASAKTFAGGGFSYPILNQGGAGDLTITGANRFKDMTNTVQPCAVVFPASTITSVENFSLNGTPGNLVSIRSSVAGTRFTLNKVAP